MLMLHGAGIYGVGTVSLWMRVRVQLTIFTFQESRKPTDLSKAFCNEGDSKLGDSV